MTVTVMMGLVMTIVLVIKMMKMLSMTMVLLHKLVMVVAKGI